MLENSVYIAQFNAKSIVIYPFHEHSGSRSELQKENEKNLTRGEFNGFMSSKTKSHVSKFLNTWIDSIFAINKDCKSFGLSSRISLTFITLTLASEQKHSDNEIKRTLLIPYIQFLQTKYNVINYFWRAEAQKNGNIHFHLIVDQYINYKELCSTWNTFQNKLGYVDAFYVKYNHTNPNSTDIHSFKKIGNVAAYVVKYCCKTEGYRKIEGRIWGCSDLLREIKPFELQSSCEVDVYVKKLIESNVCRIKVEDSVTIIIVNNKKYLAKYSESLSKQLREYLIVVFNFLYKNQSTDFNRFLYSQYSVNDNVFESITKFNNTDFSNIVTEFDEQQRVEPQQLCFDLSTVF